LTLIFSLVSCSSLDRTSRVSPLPKKICLDGQGVARLKYGRTKERFSFDASYRKESGNWIFGVQTPIYGEKLLSFGSRQAFLRSLQEAIGNEKLDRNLLLLLFLGNDAMSSLASGTVSGEVQYFSDSKDGLHIIEKSPYLLTFRVQEMTAEGDGVKSYTLELIEKGFIFNATLFTVTVRFNKCKLFS